MVYPHGIDGLPYGLSLTIGNNTIYGLRVNTRSVFDQKPSWSGEGGV